MDTMQSTLAGEVNVPDDMKNELNSCVLKILDECGIRKTEEIQLNGKGFTVIKKARPDENGIVSFDYSIFVKKQRKAVVYDMNLCKFLDSEQGYSEFSVVMNLITILLKERDSFQQNVKMFRSMPLFKIFQRDSDDEFLEFWDGENLQLSDSMKNCLDDWRERYKKIEVPLDMQMENYLPDIIDDLKEDWNCRLVDKTFVVEFMQNKDKAEYKKALVLFREIMDAPLIFFPELTRRQAIDWVIRANRNCFDRITMSAFQSLLINHKQRMKLLGF